MHLNTPRKKYQQQSKQNSYCAVLSFLVAQSPKAPSQQLWPTWSCITILFDRNTTQQHKEHTLSTEACYYLAQYENSYKNGPWSSSTISCTGGFVPSSSWPFFSLSCRRLSISASCCSRRSSWTDSRGPKTKAGSLSMDDLKVWRKNKIISFHMER